MASKKPESNAKSSAKSKRGGARANAGRKPSQAKALREKVVEVEGGEPADVDAAIRPHAIRLVANLVRLADGGYERVTRTLEPAGLVTVKRPMMVPDTTCVGLDPNGKPRMQITRDAAGVPVMVPATDASGKPIYVEDLLYPHMPPDRLVEVSRSVEVADGDRAANQYLIDRVAGKPRQAVEVTGKDGGAIQHQVQFYLPDNGRDADAAAKDQA